MSLLNNLLPWYALRVKAHHEKAVSSWLRDKGYTEFLPLYCARRRWAGRFRSVRLPLFPGYTFCRFDPLNRSVPILTTPGVLSIVGFGKTYAPVDENEIAAIQAIFNSGLAAEPWPFLKAGDTVHIEEGPLRGLDGILLQVPNGHRLVVSVTLLQRSVAVVMDRNWARPVDSKVSIMRATSDRQIYARF